MLNYIWAGLIAFSLVFALAADISDLSHNTYRNGQPLAATLKVKSADPSARQVDVDVVIDPAVYASHFDTKAKPAASYAGSLVRGERGATLHFSKDATVPEPLATVRDTTSEDKDLRAAITDDVAFADDKTAAVSLRFEPVRFVKLRAIQAAAVDTAKTAVTIALGLIGVLALWLGLMKIAEASGLIDIVVRIVQPLLHPLFPEVPKGHPALGMIAFNLAANMLGLGNAATPMGLKAMEELQKLNPTDDTATDPMVMLLAIHTACFQLVPSPTLVALLGIGAAEVYLPILIVGLFGTIVAIAAAKILGRLPMYRRTNPSLLPPRVTDSGAIGGAR